MGFNVRLPIFVLTHLHSVPSNEGSLSDVGLLSRPHGPPAEINIPTKCLPPVRRIILVSIAVFYTDTKRITLQTEDVSVRNLSRIFGVSEFRVK